jgi:hypothetical protein
MSRADARAWAQMNAQPRNLKAIRAAVLQTIATGYVLGQNAAQAYYAKAKTGRKLVKAAPTIEDIDNWLDADFWDNWTAGNKPAALLVRPPGALSDLLDKAGVTINGMNRTTLNRLGTILGDGLERGMSGKSIADAIESLLDDPARALTIANTEMARAMSTASMDTYSGFGVEMVEWLHADFCTCELCTDAEAMGPQPFGFDWSMGDGVTEPPMHPNCICAIAPVIDEGDGSGLDLADFGDVLEMSATINKFDPDQPRDELGRFGSGGGSGNETSGRDSNAGFKTEAFNDKASAAMERIENNLGFTREQMMTNSTWNNYGNIAKDRADELAAKYVADGMKPEDAQIAAKSDIATAVLAHNINQGTELREYMLAKDETERAEYERNYDKGVRLVTDLVANGEITVAISPTVLERVIAEGAIKSQFETGTSQGRLDTEWRRLAEDTIVNVPFNTADADRPVYGYLTNSDKAYKGGTWQGMTSTRNGLADTYGEARVFVRDEVRERTTYTIGDSLDFNAVGHSMNEPITQSVLDTNGFGKYLPGDDGKPGGRYVETQIHGGVKLSDITRITVPEKDVERFQTMLKEAGVEIPVGARK